MGAHVFKDRGVTEESNRKEDSQPKELSLLFVLSRVVSANFSNFVRPATTKEEDSPVRLIAFVSTPDVVSLHGRMRIVNQKE